MQAGKLARRHMKHIQCSVFVVMFDTHTQLPFILIFHPIQIQAHNTQPQQLQKCLQNSTPSREPTMYLFVPVLSFLFYLLTIQATA